MSQSEKEALTPSQKIVDRNRLRRLSVTISFRSKGGFSSKTIIKSNDSCHEQLSEAIRELAFISYFNMSPVVALNAFNEGLKKAFDVDLDSDINF